MVKRTKTLKKEWDSSGSQEDKERYKEAKKDAKRAVARAKDRAWDELYGELETPEGEKKLFKLAKKRDKAAKEDHTQIKQMKNGHGEVMTETEKINERWKAYFEKLQNEENPRSLMAMVHRTKG